jgi:DNA replication and repair protein RecF
MISSVQLQNYRSYDSISFEFDEKVNIIIGPNASGKTNLLEALIFATSGKTFRGKDENVIRENSPWSKVIVYADSVEVVLKLMREDLKVKKSFEIGGEQYTRLPKRHKTPTVIFEPNHLYLLQGSPEARRDYIDKVIAQRIPGHSVLCAAYKRTLAQRNALLKTKIAHGNNLFVWGVKLAELGAKIAMNRRQYIEKCNEQLANIYTELAGTKSSLVMHYVSECGEQYADSMMKLLESKRTADQERGFTTIGTHRDDIYFMLNKKRADTSASRGETRTILLALKIIELKMIEDTFGVHPIFMLDDVFSELDGARRSALTEYMKQYQTFITTTDADIVLHNFSQEARSIVIS